MPDGAWPCPATMSRAQEGCVRLESGQLLFTVARSWQQGLGPALGFLLVRPLLDGGWRHGGQDAGFEDARRRLFMQFRQRTFER
jgi:hypothetical protein